MLGCVFVFVSMAVFESVFVRSCSCPRLCLCLRMFGVCARVRIRVRAYACV